VVVVVGVTPDMGECEKVCGRHGDKQSNAENRISRRKEWTEKKRTLNEEVFKDEDKARYLYATPFTHSETTKQIFTPRRFV
jgi:hypothetical protein